MPVRIKVLRVSNMPYGALIWIDDRPRKFTVYIDESVITDLGAQVLESALNYIVQFWRRLNSAGIQQPVYRHPVAR